MTSIGTLLAFVIVCIGVMVMRRTARICRGRTARRWCRWCRSWGPGVPGDDGIRSMS
jgi:amino acid transporter